MATGPGGWPRVRDLVVARPAARGRAVDQAVIAVGTVLVLVHVIDHLVTEPRFGWTLRPGVVLFELLIAQAAATAGLALLYRVLEPRVRTVAAVGLGSIWAIAAFVHHVVPLAVRGPEPTDFTGIPITVGGLLIAATGFREVTRGSWGVESGGG